MRSMLLKRGDGNDYHVCALQEVPHFRRSHVRQIVFHFLFAPEWVGLRPALDCDKRREEQTENESFIHDNLLISSDYAARRSTMIVRDGRRGSKRMLGVFTGASSHSFLLDY